MTRNKLPTIIYVIIGLALIGLISQLFTNTIDFLLNIFVMVAIGGAIFAVVYFLFLRKRTPPSSDMKKYKQAVKQSKEKYKQPSMQAKSTSHHRTQQTPIKNKGKKRPSHLRVIDGQKNKRKKRASN
ncbi:hypothetical protein SAMN05216389_102371 [Oceanobacillus limi]|uniref:Uncharacterized protein n=1 Tax=Oceanobacillus limi TaxID=930131 RepID=A0A1H9ZN47_9BACI|nr:SA1362 family protein [Oceanobacillus limi]SES83104.1 hypothetical protein SAMN05216389_102371 [Oceanobacillus limi]